MQFAEKVGEKIRAVVRDVEEKLKRESGERSVVITTTYNFSPALLQ